MDEFASGMVSLIKSMTANGYTLEECLELPQLRTTYDELFAQISITEDILDSIQLILPEVSTKKVLKMLIVLSVNLPQADLWRPILDSKTDHLSENKKLVHEAVRCMLSDFNLDMLDLFYELGVSFEKAFELSHNMFEGGDWAKRHRTKNTIDYSHERVRWLLDHGADPNVPMAHDNRMDDWEEKMNAIHYYIHRPNIVEMLLDYEADPNIPMSNGQVPLYEAMELCHYETVQVLMAHPDIDLEPGDPVYRLLRVCKYPEYWPRLIEAGNSIEEPDYLGMTPIFYLTSEDTPLEVFEAFLELGPNLEVHSEEFGTVLFVACNMQLYDHAKLLLRYGADPDIPVFVRPLVPDNVTSARQLMMNHPRYNELFNHSSVKRAE